MVTRNMSIPTIALRLAGFVLAHAAWSISDVPRGELLVPLAIVERQGQRQPPKRPLISFPEVSVPGRRDAA